MMLCNLILIYYVEDFRDIIRFRKINQSCKEFGDCTILWLRLSLSFYCPDHYYLENFPRMAHWRPKTTAGDQFPFHVKQTPKISHEFL